MALTLKQKKFVEEFVISGNATEAAVKAGYSQKTACEMGAENLRKPQVIAYRDELLQKLESEKIASADEVLRYLTATMRRETPESVVVTLTKKTDVWETGEDGRRHKQTKSEDVAEVVQIPTRVADANRAAELLGKRYGLFTDKVDLTGGEIIVTITDEESGA